MTETQTLWVVLALVYGVECLAWLRPGALGFRSWLGRRWQVMQADQLIGNQRGGVAWLHPLPPLGRVFLARPAPVVLGRDAVSTAGATSSIRTQWSELTPCSVEGRHVLRDGKKWIDAGTEMMAHHVATGINRALKAAPEQRDATIQRWLDATTDTALIVKRREEFATAAAPVRHWANALFAYLFVAAPLIVWWFGLAQCWWAVVPLLLLFSVPTAITFRRAHTRLYPELREERGNHFLLVLLSPATAIRAGDLLSKPLLETFHPLAVAQVLAPSESFSRLASASLRRLRHPRRTLAPELVEWQQRELTLVESLLRREGVDVERLLAPPTASEPGISSYCPRCLAQFRVANGDCTDCGEVALMPFPAASSPKR